MKYRRSLVASGTFFFTVNLADRQSDLLVAHVESLRSVVRLTRQRHPFEIVAMVVLPDHLHAIWRLPENDTDYPTRWSLIKAGLSRRLAKSESIGASRLRKRERGVWQRRYWEHQIRDDDDLDRHVAYVHFNPVKHGYVERAIDWPYSSIHRYVGEGAVSETWGTK
ncbi:MAG: transposase [Sterolibacteriaceae bacterium]|nr:transposase [Sterolibacteriaceae bacterium]MBK9085549.1 transposase [Sterolibacteriaceae bacterium]